MFGSSYSEFVQGSALRTWDCVAHFASLLWYKFIHLRDPIMPRSRRRHHSRSRSRSRSHSHDRDREPKRRKIESYDSPHHRRSVSSEPEAIECENDDRGIDESKLSASKHNEAEKSSEKCELQSNSTADNTESTSVKNVTSDPEMKETNDQSCEISDTENELDISQEQLSESEKSSTSNNKDNDIEKSDENEALSIDSDKNENENVNKSVTEEIVDISNGEADKNNTPGKLKDKTKDLEITPKKVLSPKQLQKKFESEKKRLDKLKEKEDRERKKLEEKKKVTEEKLRLKQEKEEQRVKEKLAKEERKKKEQEEKDKKRREREEKDEQKKREREQEKLKRQQEIEEKNKEKQKLEEQKQKTAAVFANFFLPKKADSTEDKKTEESSKFMPFQIKSDMRVASISRKNLGNNERIDLDEMLEKQESSAMLYLDDLKRGKEIGKSRKTWPFEDADQEDDVIILEENVGETIVEQKLKLEKMRAKFFKFHENQRPPYFGTFKKKSKKVSARRPFRKDSIINYEVDSDEEWEEEGEGESLKGTDDEEDEKENESDNDYEVDNDLFVPHGHLSGDERDDEENVKFSPESHKAKLKLLKNEFDEEMKSKLQKIKPRVIGCIWYNKTKSNVEEAIDRYLQPFAIICNGQIEIKKRSDFAPASLKKAPKKLSKEYVPAFLKLIHGSIDKRKNIVKSFVEYMNNNGIQREVSEFSLGRQLKNFAQWQKCPEEGAMHNKMCWYVSEDIRKEYNVNLTLPNKLNRKRNKTK